MPRAYRLGKRTASVEATRKRIVEAAIELYTERGISATTMRQVQLRADIAPGTLRNHFRTREDLDRAMVERLTAEAPLPDLSIYDGAESVEERVERLTVATYRFLDQAGRIYRMWLREPMLTPVWTETGSRYGTRWAELWRAALGPLAEDDDAMTLLRAISEMTFFDSIRARRRSVEEVSSLVASVLVPWITARHAAGRDGSAGRDRSRP
ncbi:MAG: TetR/AcrR family transcriptional regulator [Chloroflexi bacterium]|nr:TetR/AcrR family transcriptional regulator [Chloroflexota bacterium]